MQHVHTGNSELSQSCAKKLQYYSQSLQLVMSGAVIGSWLCPLAFAGSSIYNLQDIVS